MRHSCVSEQFCITSPKQDKGDSGWEPVSPLSRWKETLLVNTHLLYLDKKRRVLWTCVSSVSMKGDASYGRTSPMFPRKETRCFTPVSSISTTWDTSCEHSRRKETRDFLMPLLCLDERWRMLCTYISSVSRKGDACCPCASPLSLRKETCVVYPRIICVYKRRQVLWMCVSSVSTKRDTCCGCMSPMSRRKEKPWLLLKRLQNKPHLIGIMKFKVVDVQGQIATLKIPCFCWCYRGMLLFMCMVR